MSHITLNKEKANAHKAKDWRDAASIYKRVGIISNCGGLPVGGRKERQTVLDPIIY